MNMGVMGQSSKKTTQHSNIDNDENILWVHANREIVQKSLDILMPIMRLYVSHYLK